jgi:hypothetical protein
MSDQEALVMLVNRITRGKVSIPASQVQEYLKKHTLYEEVPIYEPPPVKQKTKKIKKSVKIEKDESKGKYVSICSIILPNS